MKQEYEKLKELEQYVWNERQRINKEIKAYEMYDIFLEKMEDKIIGMADGILITRFEEIQNKKKD